MLRIRNLTKRFNEVSAVGGVSLEVPDGAFLVLVGPSGCGKSTMLRMLAGLETPSAGTIEFDGRVVSDGDKGWVIDPAARNAGLVFQSYALWPHMTVRGNVDWPLKVAGLSRAERRARADEVLDLMGIGHLSERFPNEISGGQQQRVAIARVIAPRPGILLFDEPLSNLDAKLRVEMRSELLRIHRATGATSVYVTHDQVEAMTMASHVAVMNGGRVEQFGPPAELVLSPDTAFVATFVGTPPANLVPARALPAGHPLSAQADDRFFMFRPEDLAVTAEAGRSTIGLDYAEASPMAGRTMITGTSKDMRLTAVVDRAPAFAVGQSVHFHIPERAAACFSSDGARLT